MTVAGASSSIYVGTGDWSSEVVILASGLSLS